MATELEVEQVTTTKESAGNASKASIVSNFLISLVLASSLGLVWGMINGLQIISYLPLFKVKTPGNAGDFNKFFIDTVSFEAFDTSKITAELMYFPEDDPLSLSLQEQGIDTTLMVPGLGNIFYMLLGYCALATLHLLLSLVAKKIPKVDQASSKISKFLYWNGLIRLYMEIYLDLAICALLNLKTMYWEEKLSAVSFSNVLAIISVACLGIIPIFLIVFFRWKL